MNALNTRHPLYARGVIMVLVAGIFLSLAGLVLRNLEAANGWQVLFYRSSIFAVVVLLLTIVRHRRHTPAAFRAIGLPGIVVAIALGLGSIAYIYALLLTTVANALFIISAAPLMAAILGWIVLGERVQRFTWYLMVIAVAGIGIMVFDGVAGGRVLGNAVAFITPVSFAVMLVAIRCSGNTDMLPAICLAGVVGASISFVMADSLAVSDHDLALCLFLGVVQYGAGFILITVGARFVPAAEVALLAMSEIVLAPIWVWIGVGEVPSTLTLAGGLVVVGAVVAQGISGLRSRESHPVTP